jgi:hypothetical protein
MRLRTTFAPKSADKQVTKERERKPPPPLVTLHDGPATLDGYERKPRSRGLGVGRLVIERRGTETVLLIATLRLSRKTSYTGARLLPHSYDPFSLESLDASASGSRLAFTRSYSQDPGWFLFLRLLICLSSAGVRV